MDQTLISKIFDVCYSGTYREFCKLAGNAELLLVTNRKGQNVLHATSQHRRHYKAGPTDARDKEIICDQLCEQCQIIVRVCKERPELAMQQDMYRRLPLHYAGTMQTVRKLAYVTKDFGVLSCDGLTAEQEAEKAKRFKVAGTIRQALKFPKNPVPKKSLIGKGGKTSCCGSKEDLPPPRKLKPLPIIDPKTREMVIPYNISNPADPSSTTTTKTTNITSDTEGMGDAKSSGGNAALNETQVALLEIASSNYSSTATSIDESSLELSAMYDRMEQLDLANTKILKQVKELRKGVDTRFKMLEDKIQLINSHFSSGVYDNDKNIN